MSMYANTLTVTVDGTRYTLNHGLIVKMATTRERARTCGSARDSVMILTQLRNELAESLGIDRRTASRITRSVKLSALYL